MTARCLTNVPLNQRAVNARCKIAADGVLVPARASLAIMKVLSSVTAPCGIGCHDNAMFARAIATDTARAMPACAHAALPMRASIAGSAPRRELRTRIAELLILARRLPRAYRVHSNSIADSARRPRRVSRALHQDRRVLARARDGRGPLRPVRLRALAAVAAAAATRDRVPRRDQVQTRALVLLLPVPGESTSTVRRHKSPPTDGR